MVAAVAVGISSYSLVCVLMAAGCWQLSHFKKSESGLKNILAYHFLNDMMLLNQLSSLTAKALCWLSENGSRPSKVIRPMELSQSASRKAFVCRLSSVVCLSVCQQFLKLQIL